MIKIKKKQEEEKKRKEEENGKEQNISEKEEKEKKRKEEEEKEKEEEEKRKRKSKSTGEIYLAREMPEMEEDLKISVPQARLIRQGKEVMNFEVEYTPDKSSYWYGGKYLFSFSFPEDFPYKPPKVMCKTKIYHPNIDYDGNVCLNMLKDDWNATYTALSCVSGVYYLFSEPNPNDPLNHDVAKIMRDNLNQFKDNVKRTLRGGYQFGQDFPRFTKY